MNRLLNIFTYSVLMLRRRWQKNIAIVIIYALVVAFYSSIVFLTASLKYEAQTTLADIPELWVQRISGGRLTPLPVTIADSLADIRGVAAIIPRIWGYYYDSPTGAVLTIVGSETVWTDLEMVETITVDAWHDSSLICGTGLLEIYQVNVGDWLSLIDDAGELRPFRIVGAFTSKSDLLTRDLIVLSPRSAKTMLGLGPDQVTDIALRIRNDSEIELIGRKIDRRFPGIRVVTKSQILSTYETLFGFRGGLFVYGALISLLAFLILVWDRASGLSNSERRELGLLKGIGWHINDVLWLRFGDGMTISVTATLIGILIAYVHIFLLNAPLLRPFFIGWSVLYPAYRLTPVVDLGSLLTIFCLSVIPYLSATIVPAWYGAITDPAEVMQNG